MLDLIVATVDDPVLEIIHEKRRGRPTLAVAASKLDKLQDIEKLKPVVDLPEIMF